MEKKAFSINKETLDRLRKEKRNRDKTKKENGSSLSEALREYCKKKEEDTSTAKTQSSGVRG